MEGSNQLFKPRIVEHTSKSVDYTIHDVKWLPHSSRLCSFGATARGTGIIELYTFESSVNQTVKLKLQKKYHHYQRIKCSSFGFSPSPGRSLATGGIEGALCVWDLDKKGIPVSSVSTAHKGTVYCVDGAGNTVGAPEIVSAGQDGCVKVWDIRALKSPVSGLEPESTVQECWSCSFGDSYDDENRSLCAGYANGDLKFFDLRTNQILWETNLRSGIVCTEYSSKEAKKDHMLVTTLEGKFFVIDLQTFSVETGFCVTPYKYTDSVSTIWSGRHLPQNPAIFSTTHGHGTVVLWEYQFPDQRWLGEGKEKRGIPGKIVEINKLYVTTQPICSLDWNPHKVGLGVIGAFDQKIRTIFCTKIDSLLEKKKKKKKK